MLVESCCARVVLAERPVDFRTDDSCKFFYHFLLSGDYPSLLRDYSVLSGDYLFLLLTIFFCTFLRQPLLEYAEHCL